MNTHEVYDFLESSEPIANKKQRLREYLNSQVELYRSNPAKASDIAYDIAGLLSTQITRELPEDDPYLKIMDTASKLELPDKYHGSVNWNGLLELISELPPGDEDNL